MDEQHSNDNLKAAAATTASEQEKNFDLPFSTLPTEDLTDGHQPDPQTIK